LIFNELDHLQNFEMLVKSQPKMARAVAAALDYLAQNPESGSPLRGELKGLFKHRVGSYRIIYQILQKILLINVIDIGHRRDIYR
jgi:mRNA interferase RelE/StbE